MRVYDSKEIIDALSMTDLISVVKNAAISHYKGAYHVPERSHVTFDDNTYLLMPAIGKRYFATKLVSVIPGNASINRPVVGGTLVLHDRQDGRVVAMMDAAPITALRTAAIGALGGQLIVPKAIKSIGVIGCGVQGIWQTIVTCTYRNLKRVHYYSRSQETAIQYKKAVQQRLLEVELSQEKNPENVVAKAELIICCTNSDIPVFANDDKVAQGKYFISIGSYRPNMQELPDCVYQQSKGIIVDTFTAKVESGDVINALRNHWINEDELHSMGKLLFQSNKINNDSDRFVFKSVGMAAFDLALAAAIHQKNH